jgi:hypothetical protein
MVKSFAVFGLTAVTGLWALLLAAVLLVAANAVVVFLVVRLPANYFTNPPARPVRGERHWLLHWALVAGKNLLGGLMVLIGVVLTLPGVPGPGLVLILLGVMLIDFPGKRRMVRKLMRRRSILGTVNWLRARFGRPPLVLPARRHADSSRGA